MKEVDPIEELHEIRRAIMKKAGGTPEAYARYYFEMGQKRLAASEAAEKNKKESPAKPKAKAAMRRARKPRAKATVSQ